MPKLLHKFIVTAVSTFSILNVSAAATSAQQADEQMTAGSSKPAPKKPLQGGVQHIHTIPRLDPGLKVGATFSEEMLQGLKPVNDWFRIPLWFAGTWSTTAKTVNEFHDFKSGMSDRPHKIVSNRWRGVRGTQRDRHGDIWEYKNIPSVERVETTDTIDYKVIKDYEPLEVTDHIVSRRKVETSITVDKATQRIKKITHQDIVQESVPIGTGAIKTIQSAKVFDANGSPICEQEDESRSKKVSEFAPRDTLDSQDLRTLFKEFLISSNRADLVPPELIGGTPDAK